MKQYIYMVVHRVTGIPVRDLDTGQTYFKEISDASALFGKYKGQEHLPVMLVRIPVEFLEILEEN
jgi:hypothetical protein